MDNTRAELVADDRYELNDAAVAELVIWRLPAPLSGSHHVFKYSLVLVVENVCVLRYDNERGKGDHRHLRDQEMNYVFTSLERLQVDFWIDVNKELG